MATFSTIPYSYVPTRQRLKSTAARKPAPKQSNIFDELGCNKIEGFGAGTRVEMSFLSGASSTSDQNELHIEELLYSRLQKEDFTAKDSGPKEKLRRIEGSTSEGREDFIDHSWSASGDNSGGNPDSPVGYLRNDDLSASEIVNSRTVSAEGATLDGNLLDNTNAVDMELSAHSSSLDEWHNTDSFDFHNTAPCQLFTEQRASMPNSPRSCSSPDSLSSEPLHNHNSTEATGSELHNKPVDKEHQQELGQKEDKHSHENETLPRVNDVAEEAGHRWDSGAYPSDDIDGYTRPAQPPQLLNSCDPLLEPNYCEVGDKSVGESDNEPIHEFDSDKDGDDRGPCLKKQKTPSSSFDIQKPKRRKHHLRQRFIHKEKVHVKSHRHSPKSRYPLHRRSRVVAASSPKGQLPSPAPSLFTATDAELAYSRRGSPGAVLPTLTDITFRPHSLHCWSFTALVQDSCDNQGVSFRHLTQLIESIGHVGDIEDFTVKPTDQNTFLLTGVSRYTPSQLLSNELVLSATASPSLSHNGVVPARRHHGIDANLSLPHENSGINDKSFESSSDDDGNSNDNTQENTCKVKHNRWSMLDEQRLAAYKKEDKPWEWIFKKFSNRTEPAIRTRWSIIQNRSKMGISRQVGRQ
ncbi:hypothetical protein B0O99DRAFT_694618 [Bisporella sp. PMI_857]|nr:hypothetical protein B0O99DRAFT_694618 [Bisporella sp. PMI_857]